MKKLIALVAVVSTFVLTAASTHAVTVNVKDLDNWEADNVFSDVYAIQLSENQPKPSGTTDLKLFLPGDDYHVFERSGLHSVVQFYNENEENIFEIKFSELMDDTFYDDSNIYIDLTRYNMVDAAYYNFRITQSFTSVPGGYLDYINDNANVTEYNFPFDPTSPIVVNDGEFESYNYFDDVYGLHSRYISIPFNYLEATINFPTNEYNVPSRRGVESVIRYYDTNNQFIDEIPIDRVSGSQTYEMPNDARFMRIQIVQSYSSVPAGYVTDFNDEFEMIFGEGFRASFRVGPDPYYQTNFITTITPPLDPDAPNPDYTFDYWEDSDGRKFDERRVYSEDKIFYAKFSLSTESPSTSPTDPSSPGGSADSLHNVLSVFGMNNPSGNIIFVSIVLLIINIVLISFRINGIALPVVNIATLGMFFFGGFIPFWVMMILVFILGLMLVGLRGGMQQYE